MKSATWNQPVPNCEATNSMEIYKLELQQNLPKILKRKPKVHPRKGVPSSGANRLLPSIIARKPNRNAANPSVISNRSVRTNTTSVDAQLQLPSILRNFVTPAADVHSTGNELSPNAEIEKTIPLIGLPLRIVDNQRLVLQHGNADVVYNDVINRFCPTFHHIDKFKYPHEGIGYVRRNVDQRIFLIVSIDLAPAVIPAIHDLAQLDSVYILCVNMPRRKRWMHRWQKVKGAYTSMDTIYDVVKEAIRVNPRESILISEVSIDLNGLDSTFMYTKVMKEILLTMPYDGEATKQFANFCRQKHYNPKSRTYLKVIDELEEKYHEHSSVWWYTRDCFLQRLVNDAFRHQEIDVIIKTGFFIQDLQKRIEQLFEQPMQTCTFYRGQGLSNVHFNQLLLMEGGLISFNGFLSTSIEKAVAKTYAESAAQSSELQGIIFRMTVNPAALTSTRFASLGNEGYFANNEQEVLFTMHTIFRIRKIRQREDRLTQVDLTLTSDDDIDLRHVTEYVRQQTQGTTGWDRLGKLLLGMGSFDKAEEVYQVLMANSSENHGHRCHMLGIVKGRKGEAKEALDLFSTALDVYASSPEPNHMCIAAIYNDIGSIHHRNRDFPTALNYHEMALEKQKRRTPANRSELLITYGHLADVHRSMTHFSRARSFYKEQLTLLKKSHPIKHADLVVTYEKIAEMYENERMYARALVYLRKALNIRQGHPDRENLDIVSNLNRISQVHEKAGAYFQAVEQCQQVRELLRKSVPLDHSELAKVCERIGALYEKVVKFSEALKCYREAQGYLQRSSDWEAASLARIHLNVGRMYENMGEDEEAYYSYRKAVEAERNASWSNTSRLQLYRKHFHDVQKKLCLISESTLSYSTCDEE